MIGEYKYKKLIKQIKKDRMSAVFLITAIESQRFNYCDLSADLFNHCFLA